MTHFTSAQSSDSIAKKEMRKEKKKNYEFNFFPNRDKPAGDTFGLLARVHGDEGLGGGCDHEEYNELAKTKQGMRINT